VRGLVTIVVWIKTTIRDRPGLKGPAYKGQAPVNKAGVYGNDVGVIANLPGVS
jgi:hypothetical protein